MFSEELEPRVYVTTYAKYKQGKTTGEWLEIINYSTYEAFIQACRDLHSDEENPEFMFLHRNDIPYNLCNESKIFREYFEIKQFVQTLDESDAEAFKLWFDYYEIDPRRCATETIFHYFQNTYMGRFVEDEFFKYFLNNFYNIPEDLRLFVNHDFYKKKINEEFLEMDGYYFRQMRVFSRPTKTKL